MKLFAGFLSAWTKNRQLATMPVVVKAINKHEAIGKCVEWNKKEFPTHEGFNGHFQDVVEIPHELIESVV